MKFKSKLLDLLYFFLKTMEGNKMNSSFSYFLNIFFIFAYFTQMLSYLIKINMSYISDIQLKYMEKLVFYVNFSNFLLFLDRYYIYMIAYFVILSCVAFLVFYIPFIFLMRKYLHIKASKIASTCNMLYTNLYELFYGVLILPMIDILLFPLYCDSQGQSVVFCQNKASFLLYTSIVGIVFIIFLGFFYMMMIRNYAFMDLKGIRMNFTTVQIIRYLLRISLACFYPFVSKTNEYIYHLLLHGIALLSLFDYILLSPIRSEKLSLFYISMLCSFEAVLISFSFWNLKVLLDDNLLVVIMVLMLLLIKKGIGISKAISNSLLIKGFENEQKSDHSLEELLILFHSQKTSYKNHFLLSGLLKHHAKKCTKKKCKFTAEHMKKYERMGVQDQEARINSFIFQKFCHVIDGLKKKETCEDFVLKFLSYLIQSSLSPQKAFLEAQKLPSILNNLPFYHRLVFTFLNKKLQRKIKDIDRERWLSEAKFDQNGNLKINEFFEFTRQKEHFENGMKNLLKAKISLWERFINGFQSYEETIKAINAFAAQAMSYKKNLEAYLKISKDNVILYKFFSIYYCVIVNRIIEASKYEDEIENVRKRHIRADLDQLSPIIFFQDNYITCEASFLNSNGEILESSKTHKFAKFFNYTMEETKLLTNVEALMPQIFTEYHYKFVAWSLNRPSKELVAKKQEYLVYGLDKNELIFPIKIFLSHSFSYENDFVMHAALLKLDLKGVPCLLFDSKGEVLGLTRDFYSKFQEEHHEITVDGILQLNIFNLVTKLKENVQNNKIFEDESVFEYRNMNGSLQIAHNLFEILDVIRFRRTQLENQLKKERDKVESSRNTLFSRTINSKASKVSNNNMNRTDVNNQISRFLTKWYQDSKMSQDLRNKELLEKAFLDVSVDNETFINILTANASTSKRRILYDISVHKSRYGKEKTDVMVFASLYIKHMSEQWISQDERTYQNEMTPSKKSRISDGAHLSIKMPEANYVGGFKVEFDRLNASRSELSVALSGVGIDKLSQNSKDIPILESGNQDSANRDFVKQLSTNQGIDTQQVFLTHFDQEQAEVKKIFAQKLEFDPQIIQTFVEDSNIKKSKLKSIESSKSKEERKLKNLKGRTTDLGPLENNGEENSLNASSRSTNKKSYAIINMMNVIQFKYPRSIRNISMLFFFQMLFIFSYCIALYVLSNSYVQNYYIPLQEAAIEQSKINSDFSFFASIFNEQEYVARGLESMTEFQLYAFEKLLKILEQEAMDLLHKERVKNDNFQYQPFLQNLRVNFVSFQDYKVQSILLNDMTDFFLLMVQWHFNRNNITAPLDVINVMQRNMVYYLPATANVRAKIQEEFLSSNQVVGSQILVIFALLMTIIAFEKFIEYSVYTRYMDRIVKLVNIFLRINQREASSEFYLSKQILDLLNDSKKSYQNDYFPDKWGNKTLFTDNMDNVDDKNNKNRKSNKKDKVKGNSSKKFSLYNLKTLSKNKMLGFLMISGGLIIGYLVCNYVFWTLTNSSISQLISINNMFNNLYIYSTTTMVYNDLMIREAGERDPLYEASGDPMQTHDKRMQYFLNSKNSRVNFLRQYTEDLPNFALPAQSVINDINYDELIHGSACSALYQRQRLDLEMYTFCQTDFKGAFTKGILNYMNQFLQVMSDQNSITFIPQNQSEIDYQMDQLDMYYNDITTGTLPVSVYVMTRGLILFYEYISSYYADVLNTQLGNMNYLLWITCVLVFLVVCLFCFYVIKYLMTIYTRTAFVLSLIPNEKLINDEQTIYLIKQFWKESN